MLGISSGMLDNDEINEASGLAASHINKGFLWTHNDSGDEARLFLIDQQGHHQGTVYLEGVNNRDWEDLAVVTRPQDGKSYIYVGEIGDNQSHHKRKFIYRIEEVPIASFDKDKTYHTTNIESIEFTLPDRPRDSEALLVDPLTQDVYLFSKREEQKIRLYKLPYPQSTSSIVQAELMGIIPYSSIVAADISPDGAEILVKNYGKVYYFKREKGKSVAEAILSTHPYLLPYAAEAQGEAIAFAYDGSGYFTLSEKAHQQIPHLMFFRRK